MKREKPAKIKTLRVRLSQDEDAKLAQFASLHEVTISHVIREYIRRLPRVRV
jgi:hypothetical protein